MNSDPSETDKVYQSVFDLLVPAKREEAMQYLSKKREEVTDLAPILWNMFGAISALLQELISVYPFLHGGKLKNPQSTRVCNALALFQCVASHPDTRKQFLAGK